MNKSLIIVGIVLILLLGINIYFTYKIVDYGKYFIENHFYIMYWDCNGDNETDEISSSCDDIINVQLNQGCILKSISN